jgi:hypothetical protein
MILQRRINNFMLYIITEIISNFIKTFNDNYYFLLGPRGGATSRKVAVSISDGVTRILSHLLLLPPSWVQISFSAPCSRKLSPCLLPLK